MNDKIIIKGATENNLKDIDVTIPKNQLVVITGVSGCGKSSLAFNTIYEEGKRRYMESLSSYARMFLGGSEKPKVVSIDGLCPTIAIEQKTSSHNPRSTVGTVTEIYDYLRLLFARIGVPYCPNGHGQIESLTIKKINEKVLALLKNDDKLIIYAPVASQQKGTFVTEIIDWKKAGFKRIRVDQVVVDLDDEIKLEKNSKHDIEIVIDRILFHHDEQTIERMNASINTAIEYGNQQLMISINDKMYSFSTRHCCKVCGFSIPEIEPRLFSFNSPTGACVDCKGLGYTYVCDPNKLFNMESSINDGGIDYYKNVINTDNLDWQRFVCVLKYFKIDQDTPLNQLSKEKFKLICYGNEEIIDFQLKSQSGKIYRKSEPYEGILAFIERRHNETSSEYARQNYGRYISPIACKTCHGDKLSPIALAIKINKLNIIEFTKLNINLAIDFLLSLSLSSQEKTICELLLKEIIDRLTFLKNVGLEYLTLARSANSLSGGESQRIRLATQIGSNLSGVIYVLDEPSIGLHQKDNAKLITSLKKMRDLGNTIIVVEHDLETMEEADYLIEIGPGAGKNGGQVIAYGTLAQFRQAKNCLTAKYLNSDEKIDLPKRIRPGNGQCIILKGAKLNNLKNIDITIPLSKMTVITGVSGSGKSTLVNEVLIPNIIKAKINPYVDAPIIKSLIGINQIKQVINVDQEPIGRTPRSNPATYIGVFTDIRELFASTVEAKARNLTSSHFSFNTAQGHCDACEGDGVKKISMQFLPDVYVKCSECDGKRYKDEVLAVKYKNKSIFDVLEMNIDEAVDFFTNIPNIYHKLQTLQEVGLGYLKVGANSDLLSGGEAQRVKLAKYLQKRTDDKTILVLDEPTTGLHIDDIKKLIMVLNKICDNGTTIIIIEHNLDLIKCADYLIDLGPDGGENGGQIVASGTPMQVAESKNSYTGQYLKKIFNQ